MKKNVSSIVLSFLLVASSVTGSFAASITKDSNAGVKAYSHVKYLAETIGKRVQGTEGEYNARDYIKSVFDGLAYSSTLQEFEIERKIEDNTVDTATSYNVVATKKGISEMQVIIGAHYDSKVGVGLGADDNASGVAVMLETAEAIQNIETPYTIKFVAFGAEESYKDPDTGASNRGLQGSKHYVSQMSATEISNTVAMINLDSLLAGDNMYVYGSEGQQGFVRDQALTIARRLNLNVITNPGENEEYPIGTTGDWSDHAPFQEKGIPIAYLEATNWELGDLDGYTQTVKHGEIWHTDNDTLEFLEAEFPGRVEERLSTFSNLLINLVLNLNQMEIDKLELRLGNPMFTLNGEAKTMEKAPIIHNNRTLVPLSLFTDELGFEANLSEDSNELTLEFRDSTISMSRGDLENNFTIHHNHVLVPIRYISNGFNGTLYWMSDAKAIHMVY